MDISDRLRLEKYCPKLFDDEFQKTSERDRRYNCVAYVLGSSSYWIDPLPPYGTYWPKKLDRSYSIDTFVKLFEEFGFVIDRDWSYSEEKEKIVLWGDDDNNFTHVAKLLENVQFSSKLGEYEDFTHSWNGLEFGENYGSLHCIMSRSKDQKIGLRTYVKHESENL